MGALKTLLGGIVARKVDPASLPSSKHVKAGPGRLNKVLKQDILKNEENEEVSTKTANGSLSQGSEPINFLKLLIPT
jgi:hypothetical protein